MSGPGSRLFRTLTHVPQTPPPPERGNKRNKRNNPAQTPFLMFPLLRMFPKSETQLRRGNTKTHHLPGMFLMFRMFPL